MKTKEFIEEIKQMGFKTLEDEQYIEVMLQGSSMRLAIVSKDEIYSVRTTYTSFENLDDRVQSKLFELISKYSSTPIQDREDQKKYYLKVYGSKYHYDQSDCYLNKHNSFDPPKYSYQNNDESKIQQIQTMFTDDEIEDIPIDVLRTVYKVEVQ